jgi:hypothetical protein
MVQIKTTGSIEKLFEIDTMTGDSKIPAVLKA